MWMHLLSHTCSARHASRVLRTCVVRSGSSVDHRCVGRGAARRGGKGASGLADARRRPSRVEFCSVRFYCTGSCSLSRFYLIILCPKVSRVETTTSNDRARVHRACTVFRVIFIHNPSGQAAGRALVSTRLLGAHSVCVVVDVISNER